MYLRIAPELFLKKLIVGGFSRVFELGKLFRNEGIDMTHNPEFTSCEFYMTDEDYNGLMTLTEELLSCISLATGYAGEVIFAGPYRRIDFMEGLRQYAGFNLPEDVQLDSEETFNHLEDLLIERRLVCSPKTIPKMMDKLCSEFVEPQCVQPTFIINHPAIMSPLAKQHRDNAQLTERFELFVNGRELCNAYTELNDPKIQQQRFEEQQLQKEKGDDEVQLPDTSFVNALEYGLPPTAGWGMGIDRLVMLLTDNETIREVLTFPHTKVQK
jgi:lysyl-tRNA synthetase, class II